MAKTYGQLGPNGATYGDLFGGANGATYGTEPNGGGGGNGGGGPDSGGGARARRRRRYVSTLGQIIRRR